MSKYTAIFDNERILSINDLLSDIKKHNRLFSLYSMGVIDYHLFKGLNLILSYNGYKTDNTYNIDNKYNHHELYKHLKTNVLLWFKRSSIILKYNTLKKVVQYMRLVTNNHNNRGNSLRCYYKTQYKYIERQRVDNYARAVLS